MTVSAPNVIIESVKLAEDRSGDVIVRLYESEGRRTRAHVGAAFEVGAVMATDLLERPEPAQGGRSRTWAATADLELRAFELVTLRFVRGAE